MRDAETVTFGGSGLDRAASLRPEAASLAALSGACLLPVWRGKVLLRGAGGDAGEPAATGDAPGQRLFPLSTGHALLRHAAEDPILLGRSDGSDWFAVDVSSWEPEGQSTDTVGAFHDPSAQRPPDVAPDCGFAELRTVMTALSPRDAELAATARALTGWHATHRFCARCGSPTAPADGGWQRLCAACGGRHFPRTDPVVIMLVTHGNAVLLGRSPHFPQGMYSLLAGFIEPGETIEAAVRRETAEESGVPVGEVTYLASQPWPFPASLMIGCHGTALDRAITVDPAELDDAIWVEKEELLAVHAGESDRLVPARPGAIAHFLLTRWLADTLD